MSSRIRHAASNSAPVTGTRHTSSVVSRGRPREPLPFYAAPARAHGRVDAATRAHERNPRGARVVDLLVVATALANDLPLFTRNPDDFVHLGAVGLEIRTV